MLLPLGELWYDDDERSTLQEKITRALEYYAKKSLKFSTVFVHPSMMYGVNGTSQSDIQVRSSSYVLPGHFWFCNLKKRERAVGAQPAVTRTGG